MKRYRVAICKGPDCRGNGADALFRHAQATAIALGLGTRCELYRAGCFGLCENGINVVVRENDGRPRDPLSADDYALTHAPGETYYSAMTPERIDRVLAEHVDRDEVVVELIGVPMPSPEG